MACANDVCQDLDCRAHGAQNRMILSMGQELDDLYQQVGDLKRELAQYRKAYRSLQEHLT